MRGPEAFCDSWLSCYFLVYLVLYNKNPIVLHTVVYAISGYRLIIIFRVSILNLAWPN
jgi:hypothetical protein